MPEKSNEELETKQIPQDEAKSDPTKESKAGDGVDVDKILKENEGLRQAQSTLTKSNEELKKKMERIEAGLMSVVEKDEDSEAKVDIEDTIEAVRSDVISIRRESAVNAYLSDLADEDGKPISSQVKEKAKKLADVSGLSPEDAIKKVEGVISELVDLQKSIKKPISSQPEGSQGRYTGEGIKVYR